MRIEVIEGGHPNGADLVVMGEHRFNPRAVEAAKPVSRLPAGTLIPSFDLEAVFEINKEKMAEVTAIIDAAKARGEDPRLSVPVLDPSKNPEWFDYVVYNRAWLGRPSQFQIDPRQIPFARMRMTEHIRIPLVELIQRADEVVAANEARGESH